jgi:hypothetical protein
VEDLAAMTGTATAMTPNDGNTSKHAFAPSVPFHRLGDTTANVTLAVQSHNFSLWRAEVASAISVHDFYVSVGAGSQTAVLVHNCLGDDPDAFLDSTGKVHGDLPSPADLSQYDPEALQTLRDQLEQSVQTRIAKTVELGSDYGHSARIGQEQDLIQSINTFLDN